MKRDIVSAMQEFVDGSMAVDEYLSRFEEWNRTRYLWDGMSRKEVKLLDGYLHAYIDSYSSEIQGKLGTLEKLKRGMRGIPDKSLDELKKGTVELLAALGPVS